MDPEDYAIVKLEKHIKHEVIKGLLVSPYSYEMYSNKSFERFFTHEKDITIAGFSLDKADGKIISYQTKCRHISTNELAKKFNCYAFNGASGGPAVINTNFIKPRNGIEGEHPTLVGLIRSIKSKEKKEQTYITELGNNFFKNIKKAFKEKVN